MKIKRARRRVNNKSFIEIYEDNKLVAYCIGELNKMRAY